MKHHEQFSINAPPHSEVCFELGSKSEAQTHHGGLSWPGSHVCNPAVLPLTYPTIPPHALIDIVWPKHSFHLITALFAVAWSKS